MERAWTCTIEAAFAVCLWGMGVPRDRKKGARKKQGMSDEAHDTHDDDDDDDDSPCRRNLYIEAPSAAFAQASDEHFAELK